MKPEGLSYGDRAASEGQVMKLYHTGEAEIRTPDIRRGRPNADFGQGFYLTSDEAFTRRWARREAMVNTYALDLRGLQVHRFSRDAAWFDYIFRNRRGRDGLEADVVIGPIANDTLFDTFGLITSGYLKAEEALSLLELGPAYTQVAVKTDRAAAQLRWIGAAAVPDERDQAAALSAEKAAYDRAFAERMAQILARRNP